MWQVAEKKALKRRRLEPALKRQHQVRERLFCTEANELLLSEVAVAG